MNAILAVILKQCRECDVMGPNGSDACFIGNFLMCSCITDVCPNTLWLFSLKWDGSQQPLWATLSLLGHQCDIHIPCRP